MHVLLYLIAIRVVEKARYQKHQKQAVYLLLNSAPSSPLAFLKPQAVSLQLLLFVDFSLHLFEAA